MNRSHSLSIAISLVLLSGCLPATRRLAEPGPSPRAAVESPQRLREAYADPELPHQRRTILQLAESWLGTPYAYGGTSRAGVDCSGFVRELYGAIGQRLPRSSAQQAGIGRPIALGEALPGDLVFFNTSGAGVSHVGVIVDRYSFVHASTRAGVIVSGLDENYYASRLVDVRSVLGDTRVSTMP
jgi:cell wall-associated NlpC family hydrolase